MHSSATDSTRRQSHNNGQSARATHSRQARTSRLDNARVSVQQTIRRRPANLRWLSLRQCVFGVDVFHEAVLGSEDGLGGFGATGGGGIALLDVADREFDHRVVEHASGEDLERDHSLSAVGLEVPAATRAEHANHRHVAMALRDIEPLPRILADLVRSALGRPFSIGARAGELTGWWERSRANSSTRCRGRGWSSPTHSTRLPQRWNRRDRRRVRLSKGAARLVAL